MIPIFRTVTSPDVLFETLIKTSEFSGNRLKLPLLSPLSHLNLSVRSVLRHVHPASLPGLPFRLKFRHRRAKNHVSRFLYPSGGLFRPRSLLPHLALSPDLSTRFGHIKVRYPSSSFEKVFCLPGFSRSHNVPNDIINLEASILLWAVSSSNHVMFTHRSVEF